MKSRLIVCIFSVLLFLTACSKTEIIPTEPDRCQLVDSIAQKYYFKGMNRQYLLHIPDSLPANSPLVFVLHGEDQNALDMSQLGFNEYADTNKFAICYPQAIHCKWETETRNSNDVVFLRILAQYLQSRNNFSTTKTYVVGYSQGGSMSNLLAIDAGDVFKAAASVAGSINQNIVQDCYPQYAVPTFTIHGLLDTVYPIAGSTTKKTAPMSKIINLWKQSNNCYYQGDTSMASDSTIAMVYRDSLATKEVWYYAIKGHGHTFPGLLTNGQVTDQSGIKGWEVVWNFFKKWQ